MTIAYDLCFQSVVLHVTCALAPVYFWFPRFLHFSSDLWAISSNVYTIIPVYGTIT